MAAFTSRQDQDKYIRDDAPSCWSFTFPGKPFKDSIITSSPVELSDKARIASLQALTEYYQARLEEQTTGNDYFLRVKDAMDTLVAVNEKLAQDVVASNLWQEELMQRLADAETTKEALMNQLSETEARAQAMEKELSGTANSQCGSQYAHKCDCRGGDAGDVLYDGAGIAFVPLGSAALLPGSDPLQSTTFPNQYLHQQQQQQFQEFRPTAITPRPITTRSPPQTSADPFIEKCLADQGTQKALDRERVRSENYLQELKSTRQLLAEAESRLHDMSVEMEEIRYNFQAARFGVVEYYGKCERQKNQLRDVQAANANLKKEIKNLKNQVNQFRGDRKSAKMKLALGLGQKGLERETLGDGDSTESVSTTPGDAVSVASSINSQPDTYEKDRDDKYNSTDSFDQTEATDTVPGETAVARANEPTSDDGEKGGTILGDCPMEFLAASGQMNCPACLEENMTPELIRWALCSDCNVARCTCSEKEGSETGSESSVDGGVKTAMCNEVGLAET